MSLKRPIELAEYDYCRICNDPTQVKTRKGLITHLTKHHKLKMGDYVRQFFPHIDDFCLNCNSKTTFRDYRFQAFCSAKCASNFMPGYRKANGIPNPGIGMKQSPETIAKRIANTDQKKKEEARRNTCNERYGVDNPVHITGVIETIASKGKGRKNPRDAKWQSLIVESKRKNGTGTHSVETRKKISAKVLESYERMGPRPLARATIKGKSGYVHGIFYRSSYEKRFIELCFDHKIVI